MGSAKLATNLFRIAQIEGRYRSQNIVEKERAFDVHREIRPKVRQTMLEMSGIMTEEPPVAKDVKKMATQERKQHQMRASQHNPGSWYLASPKASDPVEIDLSKDL